MRYLGYILVGCLLFICCGQKAAKAGDTATSPAITTPVTSTTTPATSSPTTSSSPATSPSASVEKAPAFDADSAYSYIERQVKFGPRVPNTPAHKACADYLASTLARFGAKIYVQEATLTAYNGDRLEARNIIGSFNPDAAKRILLFAHWDTRPYADHDASAANHRRPIDGADDGGSGVGVLLEIARRMTLLELPATLGVDIIFFDAEDYGTPEFVSDHKPDTWCLGSQFWAKNPHVPAYKAEFGILFDMVGSQGATFYKEYTSVRYSSRYVEMVWAAARELGYGKYFINAPGGAIIDDHQYVISGRRIPCIDIINYNPRSESGFGAHWHTVNDNMQNIDRQTLRAVGQTVLSVISDYDK